MARGTKGWLSGMIGVAIFSGSLPATRVAVVDLDPLFLTAARASIAGTLALATLLIFRQRPPGRSDLASLAVVAVGVVIGFPLLTALALLHINAARSIVFVGLLPLATSIFGVLRGGERPRPGFWLFSALGSLSVAIFALERSPSASLTGDGMMLASIAICGLGYAEGGRLARRLGGWQVISWALVLSLPIMLPLTWLHPPQLISAVGSHAWMALGYVSIFSMLIGFVFWYRGLALGGIAAVGQLQLLQPFLGLALAALLLNETITQKMLLAAWVVVICVAGARRYAQKAPPMPFADSPRV